MFGKRCNRRMNHCPKEDACFDFCGKKALPQQGDLRLPRSPSGQSAGGEARTCNRRIFADLRANLLPTASPTALEINYGVKGNKAEKKRNKINF
ncbi:hypothetical protein PoB_004971900 [Plakobranchus ocellatus]|uniref:Uncharacterized protein n=1 Tax=Plakobranchus ocellatus TaxID=259542 RepID=A0AAV4BWN5_9GAST|nr:hypothetical protein PoB_004971900 [Plakobranchus ocellatus]